MSQKVFKEDSETIDEIRSLINKPGWKFVEDYFIKKEKYYLDSLKKSKNIDDIRFAQAAIQIIEGFAKELNITLKQDEYTESMINKY